MATQAQIEANRRNAQKSTGPTTEYGKQAARFNALKHGMRAETSVLPYEDKLAFEELRQAFMNEYDPANTIEATLVETIANSYWRLLRARRAETQSYALHIEFLKSKHNLSEKPDPRKDDQAMAVIFCREDGYQIRLDEHATRIERCYFKAIETLRKLQKDRRREERLDTAEARKIGFVRQQQAKTAQAAGFEVSSDEKSTIIHVLRPEPASIKQSHPQTRETEYRKDQRLLSRYEKSRQKS